MATSLKIAILEPSAIIRSGLEVSLKKMSYYKPAIKWLYQENILDYTGILQSTDVDIIIVNPICVGLSPKTYGCIKPETKVIAINNSPYANDLLSGYDDVIHIWQTHQQINDIITRLIQLENIAPQAIDSTTLTPREREIVVCVVKGLTNKQIAQQLYLSTHTVITHRRNISKKLQIHTPSGLTIYAIMNKLVELEDIRSKK